MQFSLQIFFSIYLPIKLKSPCTKGHKYISHIIYLSYIMLTFICEFIFWIYTYKILRMRDQIIEKDVRNQILLNDIVNLGSGAFLRLDMYLDVCFITIAIYCGAFKLGICSIVITSIKFLIKVILFIRYIK